MNNIKTEIYLIRHGTVANPKEIIYDRLPGFHLSEEGKEQVRRLARELKGRGVKLKAIYPAPLKDVLKQLKFWLKS